jgi:PIN domain nuclease of toxin-antitoxin system
MSDLLLDTHVFLWFTLGRCLPKPIVKSIEDAQNSSKLYMSDISSWEIGMLDSKNRISLNVESLAWLKMAISNTGIQMLRLSPEIVVDSCRLPEWDHKDPSDRIIVSTSRHHSLSIITADQMIIDYGKTGHVKVLGFKKTKDCDKDQ